MKCLSTFAFLLVLIGALNWGLWGFFQFDLVAWVCGGNTTWLSRIVYAVIGLAGVWTLRLLPHCSHLCGCCSQKKGCDHNKGCGK